MRTRLLLLFPLLALVACESKVRLSDEGFERNAETGAMPAEADRFAISSVGDEIKLSLTDKVVYYRLSDKMLARLDADLKRDSSDRGGLGGAIAGAVTSGVSRLLRHRMEYDLARIQDIRFDGGQITFVFEDGTTQTPHIDTKTRGAGGEQRSQPPAFAEADVQRFIAAFHAARHSATS